MLIADLHVHSKYAMATSPQSDLPHLDLWARMKGIDLVGTGDFTHPIWRGELEAMLEVAEDGLYRLKAPYVLPCPVADAPAPRFVVTGEISTIYKKEGRTRKVHHLILLPGLDDGARLARTLEGVGNLHSDGRPILGLDSRALLAMTLDCCPQAVYIPAHVWTPHFSVLGASTGFDSLEACYGDLAGEVRAVETGLSADPAMIGRVPALDRVQLVSGSDAHSPFKLGREATVLGCEPSYGALRRAIHTGDGLLGTIEFFPQEGKYFLDGHRACGVCLTPEAARQLGGLCPVCGKKLTMGVLSRVEALAGRQSGPCRPFEHLAPLPDVLGDIMGAPPGGKKVTQLYLAMLGQLGSELFILRTAPLSDIQRVAGEGVARGIAHLRAGRVALTPGYDGVYGKVRVNPEAPVCAAPPGCASPGPIGGDRR